MKASDSDSAPTSSSATPQPSSRIRSTVRSSSAGRRASARSVISTTTRSCPAAPLGDGQQVGERSGVEHLGLDVDEDRQRREQAALDRAAEGRGTAGLVQLGEQALGARRGEQQVRRAPAGPSGPRASAS